MKIKEGIEIEENWIKGNTEIIGCGIRLKKQNQKRKEK